MRIISFSNAPAQLFWTVQVQALTPWIARIKNSLGHTAALPMAPAALRAVDAMKPSFTPGTTAASNDSVFAPSLDSPAPARRAASPTPRHNTLRVVRESDAAIQPDCAGRMVISGRMADVCAELDRMALRATTGAKTTEA